MTQQTALNTRADWEMELRFIESVNARAPGPQFNNDPACFGRYFSTQVSSATKAGFIDIADYILLHALEAR